MPVNTTGNCAAHNRAVPRDAHGECGFTRGIADMRESEAGRDQTSRIRRSRSKNEKMRAIEIATDSSHWKGRIMPNSDKLEGAASRASSNMDQIAAGAHRSVDKFAEAVHPTVDRIAAGTQSALSRMEGTASRVMDKLGERGQQLSNFQEQMAETCRTGVRSRPLTSIGLAVLAGFLLARMMRTES
jgi:ElaB/YqjD/DUF883 family membrane-anchored ribosome-binding protein